MKKLTALILGTAIIGLAETAGAMGYDDYARWCRENGGTPYASPARCIFSQAPVVDPRIAQAYTLNEAGRRAMAVKDYDRAIELFSRAFNTYPDPIYRDNQNLALADKHFDLGGAAYDRRDWATAIAEYQRAESFHKMDAAEANIRLARSNQALDGADAAMQRRQYDEAILFYQEAYRWRPDPNIQEQIRHARLAKLIGQGNDLFAARRYAEAESLYAQALQIDPHSVAAAENRVLAIRRQADVIAQAGNLDTALAAFDHMIATYESMGWFFSSDAGFRSGWENALADARARLVALARSPTQMQNLVDMFQRWWALSGHDKAAERELANVRAAQAGRIVQQSQNTDDLSAAVKTYDRVLQDNPDNAPARQGREQAAKELAAAKSTQSWMQSLTGPASRIASALEQAKAAANENGGACFDGSPGCTPNPSAGNAVIATPTATSPFLPAEQETPAMKTLRTEIAALDHERQEIETKLKGETDPMKRYEEKNSLALKESTVYTKQIQYDEQKKVQLQKLAAHRIAPKGKSPEQAPPPPQP